MRLITISAEESQVLNLNKLIQLRSQVLNIKNLIFKCLKINNLNLSALSDMFSGPHMCFAVFGG